MRSTQNVYGNHPHGTVGKGQLHHGVRLRWRDDERGTVTPVTTRQRSKNARRKAERYGAMGRV